jgi:sensor histidine kinase YesM
VCDKYLASMNAISFPEGIIGVLVGIIALVWVVLLALMPFVLYGIYQGVLRIEKIAKNMQEADRQRWVREMNKGR